MDNTPQLLLEKIASFEKEQDEMKRKRAEDEKIMKETLKRCSREDQTTRVQRVTVRADDPEAQGEHHCARWRHTRTNRRTNTPLQPPPQSQS